MIHTVVKERSSFSHERREVRRGSGKNNNFLPVLVGERRLESLHWKTMGKQRAESALLGLAWSCPIDPPWLACAYNVDDLYHTGRIYLPGMEKVVYIVCAYYTYVHRVCTWLLDSRKAWEANIAIEWLPCTNRTWLYNLAYLTKHCGWRGICSLSILFGEDRLNHVCKCTRYRL